MLLTIVAIWGSLLFTLTANGGNGTTVRQNTQITRHAQQNTAHKTTQTIKDILQTTNILQMQLITINKTN
jgi:hypothetical protein